MALRYRPAIKVSENSYVLKIHSSAAGPEIRSAMKRGLESKAINQGTAI